jgi:hypothetical protein
MPSAGTKRTSPSTPSWSGDPEISYTCQAITACNTVTPVPESTRLPANQRKLRIRSAASGS